MIGDWITRNGLKVKVTGYNPLVKVWVGYIVTPDFIQADRKIISIPLVWKESMNEFTGVNGFDLVKKLPDEDMNPVIGKSTSCPIADRIAREKKP